MKAPRIVSLGLAAACYACFALPPAALAGERTAASYLPADLPVVAVLRDGDRQVQALQALLDDLDFEDSDAFRALEANPQLVQARIGAYGVAAMAGTDPWSGAGVLLGRELAIGVTAGDGKGPRVAIVSVARDAAALDRLLTPLQRMAGLERDGKPDESRSQLVDGVRVFNAGKDFYHCRMADALIICNHRELIRRIVSIASSGEKTMAASDAYRTVERDAPADAAAWAFADLAAIRKLLGPDRELPAQIGNPLGGFVAGGWWHAIRHADAAVAWATPTNRGLRAELRVAAREPLPETYRGFAPPKPTCLRWPAERLPRYVGEIAITRDWADLFAERETILSLTAAAQIVQFNNTITTLLGQMDFTDDILPIISGPVRLIVAAQDFSTLPYEPTPKLPAFALVTPLRFPDQSGFAKRMFSATQTAISALSLIAAQEGNPTYLIDTDRYAGYRIATTEYGDPDEMDAMRKEMAAGDDGAPMPPTDDTAATSAPSRRLAGVRYNFAPAAALVEDQYVIATSTEMLRNIIDAIAAAKLANEHPPQREAPPDTLDVRAAAIVALLRENYTELVANAMLEKDQPKAQAEREIDTLLAILDFADRLSITSQTNDRGVTATLELRLTKPAAKVRP